eukprot:9886000-Prorocentrum_lima.AAC.1
MTAIYHDTLQTLVSQGSDPSHARVPGMSFSAVFYADDTLLMTNSSGSLTKLLQTLQRVGIEYGLRLNK